MDKVAVRPCASTGRGNCSCVRRARAGEGWFLSIRDINAQDQVANGSIQNTGNLISNV